MKDDKFDRLMEKYVSSTKRGADVDLQKLREKSQEEIKSKRIMPKYAWVACAVILVITISLSVALPILLNKEEVDTDGMNYLAGKSVDFVNKSAMNGTILAHTDGNVPNLVINIPAQDEFYLGELFYFFEFACGISGYILGVNPFNQPGVESYKKNMFALLGKPGYEAQREELLKRL